MRCRILFGWVGGGAANGDNDNPLQKIELKEKL